MVVPAAGLTVILDPVPAGVPPHEPENHSHSASVPREPPNTESVLFVPKQVLLFMMFTVAGATEPVPSTSHRFLVGPSPHEFDA